ncbi:putative C6 finger domain protein [Aspergillus nomiae NRRL 13137]|uniref:Putative C6 finger domain protein n=1 Tax=Aspergillus nomiae NRRL (strain ATCC 15546 / NRRL 13137 / CBS 260.88 / M93) TaxID=1509407 RepID=A0A0L1IKX8_ASPN3|nr:putative C6 finger domain protein [Aspergillus nomiae NRRL 13137]KNG80162.1 putative C6 finger domain protein [Aspergillus nomiae NRRL 13137]
MVGVPRSTGCRACLQRRVKCDQTRPECLRCLKRKITCPGYQKRFQFYHKTAPAIVKSTRTSESDDARPSRSTPKDNHHQQLALVAARPPIDQCFAPTLTANALDTQLKEVFSDVVYATFPNLYAAFSARVDLTWVDFVRHHSATQPSAVNWGIRCLNTWFLARRHHDHDQLQASRHMYNRALRCLAQSIRDPARVKSDSTLAAAIALGVYEVLDGIGPNSWLVHSRGIGALFRLRGPDAHRSGFGRTMYTTYRTFLVAEAFTCQEPCFLEGEEWRTMNQEALRAEERDGKGSQLSEITEKAFGEVLLCPGYLVRTREMITGKASESSNESLAAEIRCSRDLLRGLQRRLAALLNLQMNSQAVQKRTLLDGSIPQQFVHTIAHSSLRGMDSALALLDQLLVLLAASKKRMLGSEKNPPPSPWNTVTYRPAPEEALPVSNECTSTNEAKSLDWLDQLALSMGTLALKT